LIQPELHFAKVSVWHNAAWAITEAAANLDLRRPFILGDARAKTKLMVFLTRDMIDWRARMLIPCAARPCARPSSTTGNAEFRHTPAMADRL